MQTLPATCPAPRLSPIDRPRGLLQRLLRWYFRLRFGKVMMPLRVIHPRIPRYGLAYVALVYFAERGLSLPAALRHRLALEVSRERGCSFCSDLHQAVAVDEGVCALPPGDGHASWLEEAAADTLAALAYGREVARTGTASDATFDALRAHFDEREIVEIVWLVAFTSFHNLMARPLGLSSDGFTELQRDRRRGAGARGGSMEAP